MSKRNVLLLVVIVVLGLLLLYRRTARSRQDDDMAVLECANLYANATTAADSALVDSTHPIQQPRGSATRVTCADLH